MYILELQYKIWIRIYKELVIHLNCGGSQVFRNIYTYLGGKYGISQYLYQLDLPFLKHNGLNTGNVYTTFYQFYYDFGYDGIVPLMAILLYI